MKVFRTVVCAVVAALAATAMAQEAKPGPRFEFHGFIGGSLWSQDAIFNGYGQQVFYVAKQPNSDKLTYGGDARQTRLNLSLAGPTVFGGAVPKGVAELDFFSGLNVPTGATGTTGPVAVAPRLRLSYAELNWGTTIFRMGQDNDLILGTFAPTSVGHIPQSYGYGSGYIGTRHLAAEVFQTVPAGDMRVEFAFQVQSQIIGTPDTVGTAAGNTLTTSEASGIPGLEARVRLVMPKLFDMYVAGHWQKYDRNGQDNTLGTGRLGDSQYSTDGTVGAKLTLGPVTLQGQGHIGNNMGNGNLSGAVGGQAVANTQFDFRELAGWVQAGYNLTPEFSAWAYAGTERARNFQDAIVALGPNVRLANTTFGGMLRYMDGGYALALEYLHMITRYGSPQANAKVAVNGVLTNQARMDGNQLMLSGYYFF